MARGERFLLRCAAACALAFVFLLVVAYHSPLARWTDARALEDFAGIEQRPLLGSLGERIVELANLQPMLVLTFGVLLVALATARLRQGVAAFTLIAAANVTTQILKPLLAEPRSASVLDQGPPSAEGFPSGHATVAMSLALALVIVAPRAWRGFASVAGTGLVLAVSFSLLGLAWHFPSDVLGGYLVATGWCFVALAGLEAAWRRWPERSGRDAALRALERHASPGRVAATLAPLAVTGATGLSVCLAIALTRHSEVGAYAHTHTAALGVAAVITVAAVTLLAAVTVVATARRS
jgi:membrane-associated phospholipid phosphatase